MTQTLDQANDLIHTASKHNLVLQIGHIERFNPAVLPLPSLIHQPKLIESIRTGPFQSRNLDISVILDLMIHDIDMLQFLHPSPIKKIEATGLSLLSSFYDVANVRLVFEDGCVAHLIASRMSLKKERTLKIYQSDLHMFVDYQEQALSTQHKEQSHMVEHIIPKTDTLAMQIQSFIHSIILNQKPKVSGEEGKKALITALAITHAMREQEKTPVFI